MKVFAKVSAWLLNPRSVIVGEVAVGYSGATATLLAGSATQLVALATLAISVPGANLECIHKTAKI